METLVEKEVFNYLSIRLLPAIIAARRPSPWYWRGAGVAQFYLTEAASILVGWGIVSTPVAAMFSQKAPDPSTKWTAFNVMILVLAGVWGLFVLWFKRNKIADKLVLGEACTKAFRSIGDELHNILADEVHPPKALVALSARIVEAMKHHRDGFAVEPRSQEISEEATTEATTIVNKYKHLWRDELGVPQISAAGGAA